MYIFFWGGGRRKDPSFHFLFLFWLILRSKEFFLWWFIKEILYQCWLSKNSSSIYLQIFPSQDSKRLCWDFLQSASSFSQLFESFPLLPKPIEPLGEEPSAANGNGPVSEALGDVLAAPSSPASLQYPWGEEEGPGGGPGRLQYPREEVKDDRKAEIFEEAQFWRGEVKSCVRHVDQSAGGGGEHPGGPQGWELLTRLESATERTENVNFWLIPREINLQSLEDTHVGYISQKYTWDKYTLEQAFEPSYTLETCDLWDICSEWWWDVTREQFCHFLWQFLQLLTIYGQFWKFLTTLTFLDNFTLLTIF